jgi:pimeloyl-ACP methyl ester carboxylesterase
MATPHLTKASVPGSLGEIMVDVRTADRATAGPAVLVLHGFKGFKDWGMFPPFSERLARSGFTAVTFNVSGSGADDRGDFTLLDRFGHNTFSAELLDIAIVLEALDAGGLGVAKPTSVGIVGHSRGGGIAVLAARRHQRITALVTWAAIASVERWTPEQRRDWRARGQIEIVNGRTGQIMPIFTETLDDIETHGSSRLDIIAAARALTDPWLLVHGDADAAVPVAEARQLAAASATKPELVIIDGGGHTFGAAHPWAGPTPELDRVFDATIRFLSTHLA